MKVIYKNKNEITKYCVGDVIQQEESIYLVVVDGLSSFAQVCLSNGEVVTDWYHSLDELFDGEHTAGEKLVKATLTIE